MDFTPLTPLIPGVRRLADFLFRAQSATGLIFLWGASEIIGTLIDLKPATMISCDFTPADLATFQKLITSLHLVSVIEELPIPKLPPGQHAYMIFISRQRQTAQKLQVAHRNYLALGWCPGDPADQKLNSEIGHLLGYPPTAIDYFNSGPRDARGIVLHRPGAEHDRYYLHSPDHFRTEYQQFEDILHPALATLCPPVAKRLRADHTKYWTSADL